MAEPADASRSDDVDALLSGIFRGVLPDEGAASRLSDEALRRVFRQVLRERAETGREQIAEIARRDADRVGDLAIEAIGKWGGAEASAILASLEGASASTARRKALRRARHICTSIHGRSTAGGVSTSPRERPDSGPEAAASDGTAWMTAPGMMGGRVWLFRRAGPPGRMAMIAISDTRGVRDFNWKDGGDDEFERYRAHLVSHGHQLGPVPWNWLVRRLVEAEARNERRSEPLPANWHVLRGWVGVEAAMAAAPIAHPALPPETTLHMGELPAPAEVLGLLELKETEEWVLPPHAFEGREQELAEAGQSQLVLEGLDPRARVQRVVGTALEEYLATDERMVWTERLLDLAHVLNTTEREREGKVAAIIAGDLNSDARSPLADAFLWALAGRSLGIAPRSAGGSGDGGANEAGPGDRGPGDEPPDQGGLIVP